MRILVADGKLIWKPCSLEKLANNVSEVDIIIAHGVINTRRDTVVTY